MATDPLIDTVVAGRYRVQSLLGEGGMGAVYRVEHATLRKQYALKVLRLHATDAEAVARFDREARAAAHLEHKNIARCIDVGTLDDGGRFLVMELVDGEPLTALLARDGALSPDRALPLLSQIAKALACAHERQIVHRDMKPDNVVLASDGSRTPVVKLIDFGIARAKSQALGGGATALTKAGTMLGTPAYMSPEQVVGQTVDARADQYSFGVIAFEMLTGAPPYSADEPLSLVFKHVGEEIPRASQRNAALNPAVDGVFDRLLAKLPDERFRSVNDGYEALEAALYGRATQPVVSIAQAPRVTQPNAIPARESVVSAPQPAVLALATQPLAAPAATQRSARAYVLAALLGAALLLGGVVAFFAGRGGAAEQPADAPASAQTGAQTGAASGAENTGTTPQERRARDDEERDDDERDEERGPGRKRGGHKRGPRR